MIIVGDAYISDEVIEEQFACDLAKCKGACCVEGDAGAPLTVDEAQWIKNSYRVIKPYLSKESREIISKEGTHVVDTDGDLVTPTIGNRECVYAIYDAEQTLRCAFEIADREKNTGFKKPLSCHLYPIRVTKYAQYDALNYDRWSICSDACTLGKSLKLPVYQFLKEPLIRAYGEEWFRELEAEANDHSARNR